MTRTKDHVYLRNRAHILATSDTCAICGQWIDPSLKFPDRWSFSADHITPISRGGDNRGQLQAAHL